MGAEQQARPVVLVVEDDHVIRMILGEVLEDEGYRVVLAGNGDEGLTAALSESVDLILLDLNMPQAGGPEFCATYRDRGGTAPVVISTAAITAAVAACGAVGYIRQPFDLDAVLALVARYARPRKRVDGRD